MKKTLVILFVLMFCITAFAAFETRQIDAASAAFADIPPELGISNMSLFGDYGISAGGGYLMSYGHSDFSEFAGYAAYGKENMGRALLTMSSFSTDETGETKLGIAYTRSVISDFHNKVELALRADIYSLSYEPSMTGVELGSATSAGLSAGIQATVNQRTRLGLFANNLTCTNMGENDEIEIPRAVTGVLAYSPYTNTEMAFYIRREAGQDFEYAVAGYARPHEFISFRAGAMTNPDRFTGGIGIHYSYFTLDYALQTHPVLPLSHVVSFNFNLMQK